MVGIFRAKSFFGLYAGIVNMASAIVNVQEMLSEPGVNVNHTTIYRWVQRYAPENKNAYAGIGVILHISAHGILMKLM